MNSKDKNCMPGWAFLIVISVLAVILMVVYNAITADMPQVFTDVIYETTSMQGSNKSAERNLYYIFSLAGGLIYFIWYLIRCRRGTDTAGARTPDRDSRIPVAGIITAMLIGQFLFSSPGVITVSCAVLCLVILLKDRALLIDGAGFFFICIYSVCSVYRIYVYLGGWNNIGIEHVCIISLALSLILLCMSGRFKDIYARSVMVLQVFVPFLLLVFLASGYRFEETDITIPVPGRIRLFIFACIGAMLFEAAFIIYRDRKAKILKLSDVISYGSCIAIMTFNGFTEKGAIISPDYHHPYENIIGFFQMFGLSQKAFSQYIPVSGFYSLLTGGIFALFGKGQVTYYNVSQNIFILFTAALIVILLGKTLVNREWLLLISLTFRAISYNRIALIMPVFLILSYPGLIKKKNTWLKAWFLTSLVHGLYYPLFGAATALAFLPLALYQLVSYVRSGELKKDAARPVFYLWWALCILPALLSASWLIGTYKHISAMGGQTIYADGLTRFAQVLPDNLLTYVDSMSVKMLVYYVLSYILPVSIIWVSVALAMHLGEVEKGERAVKVSRPVEFCLAISAGILMLVSFSYTVIRMDIGGIYARSKGVVIAVSAFLMVLADRYIKNERIRRMTFIYAVLIIGVVDVAYIAAPAKEKLKSTYTVPDGYMYTDGSGNRLGEGFINNDGEVFSICEKTAVLDKDKSYFALGDFGYYYLYDLKGDGPMEAVTVKGYEAAGETMEVLKQNHTYVGTSLDPIGNYYLYNWLVTSGEYRWDEDAGLFIPCDEVLSSDAVREYNRDNGAAADSQMILRTACSWGDSIGTLNPIFTDVPIDHSQKESEGGLSIGFNDDLDGNDADFVYLEIDNDHNYDHKLFHMTYAISQECEDSPLYRYLIKKDYNPGRNVLISWSDDDGNEHSMTCSLGRGKLLIPLGGGKGWLLNSHKEIRISMIDDNGDPIDMVGDVSGIRFLKLREL